MIAIDSSVVIAALFQVEIHHAKCLRIIEAGNVSFYSHGLAEVFSTMTGGRAALRLKPKQAAELIDEDVVPSLDVVSLTTHETLNALRLAATCGIQGGAIYDFLHLAAARKKKATKFFTLNMSHFLAFHRPGDPEISHP